MLRRYRLPLLAAVMLTPVLYVLSYAPLYRFSRGSDAYVAGLGVWSRPPENWESIAYLPVLALIDQSPASRPLLAWAELWGVRQQQQIDCILRRLTSSHPLLLDH